MRRTATLGVSPCAIVSQSDCCGVSNPPTQRTIGRREKDGKDLEDARDLKGEKELRFVRLVEKSAQSLARLTMNYRA